MDWETFIGAFLEARAARGATAKTLALYRTALAQLALWAQTAADGEPAAPDTLSALDLAEYRRHLQTRLQPSSVNTRLRQLKAAFAWAQETGRVRQSPAAALRFIPDTPPPLKALSRRTVAALLRAAERAGSVRDVTLFTLLAQTGLRVSEATQLTWGALVLRERSGAVVVHRGKGGKRRTVPLTVTARRALLHWRTIGWPTPPAADTPVFPGRRGRSLTPRAVERALAVYSRQAGLAEVVTPHMFRHAFCKALVDGGASLDRVAALAGHASLTTTMRYTRPTDADLTEVVEALEWV